MTTPVRRFWSEVTKRRVAAAQKFCCAACSNLLGPVWAADHRVALMNGGDNSIANLQILCVECHAIKTQLEVIRGADCRREGRTGVSKYFDETSEFFVGRSANDAKHPRLAAVCERLRKRRRERL